MKRDVDHAKPPDPKVCALTIYNVVGQVRTLVAEHQDAGQYAVAWDATDERGQHVSAGIYFLHLQIGSRVAKVEKMLLVK